MVLEPPIIPLSGVICVFQEKNMSNFRGEITHLSRGSDQRSNYGICMQRPGLDPFVLAPGLSLEGVAPHKSTAGTNQEHNRRWGKPITSKTGGKTLAKYGQPSYKQTSYEQILKYKTSNTNNTRNSETQKQHSRTSGKTHT